MIRFSTFLMMIFMLCKFTFRLSVDLLKEKFFFIKFQLWKIWAVLWGKRFRRNDGISLWNLSLLHIWFEKSNDWLFHKPHFVLTFNVRRNTDDVEIKKSIHRSVLPSVDGSIKSINLFCFHTIPQFIHVCYNFKWWFVFHAPFHDY